MRLSKNGMSGCGSTIQIMIQQLNQRKSDPNLTLILRPVEASQNALARYLAEIGPLQRYRLVMSMKTGYRQVDEEEVQGEGVIEITDDDEDEDVADASRLVAGADHPGMRGRH
ncbi:hypothetical protein DCAR_0727839 [Daucus carota subsp. sativus]|uniref:Uncharacterized protein n=1 Tax=Daucus carota subsp. sativus TaxID=79200 RepID=A0A164TE65_DAUCS|nr:hypothetical protein DCAR_0727839 [Daucus carota subsp. sativus]